jgi:transcriptional regulator with XRE-family HTH domain
MDSVSNKSIELLQLAKRIKTARSDAQLSQAELAHGIGVSDKSISAYEQGRSTPPFEKLKKIAVETNHPIGFFTEDNNEEANISSKLASIERELAEVKLLLKQVTK